MPTIDVKCNKIYHFLLTTRPYSYGCNVARGVMICGLLGLANDNEALWISAITSFIMWFFLNWYSELKQKNLGRIIPNWYLPSIPLLITIIISFWYNDEVIPYLLIFTLSILIYPLKAIKPYLGVFGPIFRGGTVIAHSIFIVALLDGLDKLSEDTVFVILALAILHIGRNLVGDLRDVHQDLYEFPKRFGYQVTMWVLRIIFSFTLIILPISFTIAIYPIVIIWAALEFLAWGFGEKNQNLTGYIGHRIYIIVFTFTEILIAFQAGVEANICIFLVFLTLGLHFTYSYIPGKNYPHLPKLISKFHHN